MPQDPRPYFLTPAQGPQGAPLFVFLPGLDETGKDLLRFQTAGLEMVFDVRCFVIPSHLLSNWDTLAEQVIALTQSELRLMPLSEGAVLRSPVYLCGESFGACIAVKVLLKAPQLFKRIILINLASSFHRVLWIDLGTLLFPWTPQLFYKLFSLTALPFLAPLNRLSYQIRSYDHNMVVLQK